MFEEYMFGLYNLLPEALLVDGQDMSAYESVELFPEEDVYIQDAILKRKREFACGRDVARRMLLEFAYSEVPILKDVNGCPLWPEGITGSITHTDEYCLVALARTTDLRSVGVDLEVIKSVDSSIWPLLFTEREMSRLKCHNNNHLQQKLASVYFVAKEAFYKCNYPINKKWIDFKEINVEFDANSGAIYFYDQNNCHLKAYNGISVVVSNHMLSIVWCEHVGLQ